VVGASVEDGVSLVVGSIVVVGNSLVVDVGTSVSDVSIDVSVVVVVIDVMLAEKDEFSVEVVGSGKTLVLSKVAEVGN
jgi:hypothetical protein